MMLRLMLLFTLLTTLPGVALARGPADVLAGMHGKWQGRGVARETASSPKEAVACMLEGRWERNIKTLRIRYLCLGADVRFESNGIMRLSGDKVLSTIDVHGRGRISGRGKASGNRIELVFSGKDEKRRAVRAVLTMKRAGKGRLTTVLRATDPDSGRMFTAFTLTLKSK